VTTGAPAAGGATTIRRATPADFAAVAHLLSMRDERAWDVESVRWFLQDFDPGRCMGWLAFAGERPIGLTTVYVRDLMIGAQAVHTAYWANLFIDPAYRDRMLYPRLPLAMFPELKAAGVRFTYAAVRRPDVARAHHAIGFTPIGAWTLRLKPLRPLRNRERAAIDVPKNERPGDERERPRKRPAVSQDMPAVVASPSNTAHGDYEQHRQQEECRNACLMPRQPAR